MRARDNPFRAERIESLRYRAPGFRWPALLEKLSGQQGRGAIRGPQGSGKTTLLHELAKRLGRAGWEVRHLRPDLDDRKLARAELRAMTEQARQRTALLLDGADRLGPLTWNLFVRKSTAAGILVVTTHRERRLPTLHRCSTSPALLAELVAELVAELTPALEPPAPSLHELFERERGDIRGALRALYDLGERPESLTLAHWTSSH